jgi:hypothetical protein
VRCCSLNVCATNFTKSRPDQTIANVFARTAKNSNGKAQPNTSEVQFIELSSDEDENQRPDPVFLDSDMDDIKPSKPSTLPKTEEGLVADTMPDAPASQDDDLVFVGEERAAVMNCKECGSRLFAFSAEAHMKFHEESKKSIAKTTSSRGRLYGKKTKGR